MDKLSDILANGGVEAVRWNGEAIGPSRGAIYKELAYAQGKMLNHKTWKLPRNITPSDVDMAFDDHGRLLHCELSREHTMWLQLKVGQRQLYEAYAKKGVMCALLNHDVPLTRQINSRDDIVSFALLFAVDGELFTTNPFPGGGWAAFVEDHWYSNHEYVMRIAREEACPLYLSMPAETTQRVQRPFKF